MVHGPAEGRALILTHKSGFYHSQGGRRSSVITISPHVVVRLGSSV